MFSEERARRLFRHQVAGCLQDLGHRHATQALQAGVHPQVVSGRLGQATVTRRHGASPCSVWAKIPCPCDGYRRYVGNSEAGATAAVGAEPPQARDTR